jgi:predicted nucleic acid-binding protein
MRCDRAGPPLRDAPTSDADQLLRGVALVPLDNSILDAAETLPSATVATLDAIHLATALELASGGVLEAVMTYDPRLAEGEEQHGLRVLAPD